MEEEKKQEAAPVAKGAELVPARQTAMQLSGTMHPKTRAFLEKHPRMSIDPGQVDEKLVFGDDVHSMNIAIKLTEQIRARMAEPGSLNLPPLLDKRRLQWGIPDGAFREQAMFERVLIWQIPLHDDLAETCGLDGSMILKPETTQVAQARTSTRGIIVSAGLRALDILRTNGIDLGHIVKIMAVAPFREKVDHVAGEDQFLININAGDIISSEDLGIRLRAGEYATLYNGNNKTVHWPSDMKDQVYEAPDYLTPWVNEDWT